MAESVDALVSNTSGATRAGSTPALGTSLKSKKCHKSLIYDTFNNYFEVSVLLFHIFSLFLLPKYATTA